MGIFVQIFLIIMGACVGIGVKDAVDTVKKNKKEIKKTEGAKKDFELKKHL